MPNSASTLAVTTAERRRASAIYAMLAGGTGPLSAADIALTLRAYVRYGGATSPDGGRTFALRRVA